MDEQFMELVKDLQVGGMYDFHLAEGFTYEGAVLHSVENDGVWFSVGLARVFVSDHELSGVDG